uniref:hypothetical protein n=1 Tax=Acetatifactor sp. TaxID=1872090 RepID=UPI00405642FA
MEYNFNGGNPEGMVPNWMNQNGMGQNGMNFRGMNPSRRNTFGSVVGTIVDMVPARMGNMRADGCMIFVTVEDMDGNTVNFMVTPSTFVVDWETLSVGMNCTFWYRADAPVPLIYPPQYTAVVAAQNKNSRMIDVGYYNTSMINESQTLQLNVDGMVDIRTTNNQYFQGSPANHNLVVVYDTSTRSIPAQTTPKQIVVLCER